MHPDSLWIWCYISWLLTYLLTYLHGAECFIVSAGVLWVHLLWWSDVTSALFAGQSCWRYHTLHRCVARSARWPSCAATTAGRGKSIRLRRRRRRCRSVWVVTLKVKVIMSAWCMGARLFLFIFLLSLSLIVCVCVYVVIMFLRSPQCIKLCRTCSRLDCAEFLGRFKPSSSLLYFSDGLLVSRACMSWCSVAAKCCCGHFPQWWVLTSGSCASRLGSLCVCNVGYFMKSRCGLRRCSVIAVECHR